MVQTIGWRWAFLINLPLAVVVLVVSLRHVPETADPGAHRAASISPVPRWRARPGRPDVRADRCGRRLESRRVLVGLLGVAALVAFVAVERREATRCCRSRSSRRGSSVPPTWSRCWSTPHWARMFFLLVVQLQVVAGFDALAAGSALLPITIIMLLLSGSAGQLAERIGPRLADDAGTAAGRGRGTAAAPHRAGRLVRHRRTARRGHHRARTRPDRRATDRDGAGGARGPSRRHRQRGQQRGRPRRWAARGGGAPGCWSDCGGTTTPNRRPSTRGSTAPWSSAPSCSSAGGVLSPADHPLAAGRRARHEPAPPPGRMAPRPAAPAALRRGAPPLTQRSATAGRGRPRSVRAEPSRPPEYARTWPQDDDRESGGPMAEAGDSHRGPLPPRAATRRRRDGGGLGGTGTSASTAR